MEKQEMGKGDEQKEKGGREGGREGGRRGEMATSKAWNSAQGVGSTCLVLAQKGTKLEGTPLVVGISQAFGVTTLMSFSKEPVCNRMATSQAREEFLKLFI